MKINFNRLGISIVIAMIICVLSSIIAFEANCQELRNNVLRLHIIANSNSEADQNLKLQIRDALINKQIVDFKECTTLDEAILSAENSIDKINETALQVIKNNNYNYNVEVSVDKSYFDTRIYDDFTLPAGIYDAVIVKIGEAKGKNWWCVMFPSLCLPAADCDQLSDYVEKDSAKIALNPKNYQIRFKTVEIYQYIKKNLAKT